MAKNGFKVMDSDMHVFEPADLWQRYIDPKYADRAPKGLNRSFRDLGIEVEGKTLPIPRNPENPAAKTALVLRKLRRLGKHSAGNIVVSH